MKGLFAHFTLIAMLLIHLSFSSVMAAQMVSMNLSMNTDSSFDSLTEDKETTISEEPIIETVKSNQSIPTIEFLLQYNSHTLFYKR